MTEQEPIAVIENEDPLEGLTVALGVTGSISCYKSLEIASRLVQAGATVDVIMTKSATQFVQPLAFKAITARVPYVDMFDPAAPEGESHVEIARRCDAMLIAPATASSMSKIANGLSDDFVSLTAIATKSPVLLAPAMDSNMWDHFATQANLSTLTDAGIQIIGPTEGRLASGRTGYGRLVEPIDIVDELRARIGRERGDLRGRRVVVTAGGSREAIDPVRFISNRSSGKMGYAIAQAARDRGALVTLISTVDRRVPACVQLVEVESAADMHEAVLSETRTADILVMAAAVADYRPAAVADQKIKKTDDDKGDASILLEKTTDIIASVSREQASGRLVKVAFAAETENLLANARKKIESKNIDFIVANDVSATDSGFATDTNRVTIIDEQGTEESLPLMSKVLVGHKILSRSLGLLESP